MTYLEQRTKHFQNQDKALALSPEQQKSFLAKLSADPRYGIEIYPQLIGTAEMMSEIDGRPVIQNALLGGPTSQKDGYNDWLNWLSHMLDSFSGLSAAK